MSDLNHYEEEEFTTHFNGRTVLRILGQLKPHWLWAVGFLSAAVVVAFTESYFTFLSKRIIDEGIVAKDPAALTHLLWQYGGMILVQSAFVFCFIYLCGLLGERVRYDLRQKMFAHLQKLSLSYYNRTPVGWIMSRVTSDTERVSELVTWGLLDVVWSVLNIAAAVYFMLIINVPLALIVCLIIPIIVAIAIRFERLIITEYRDVRKINSKITGAYNENITGVRVVKALDQETRNAQEFGQLTGGMYRAAYRAALLSALFLPTVQIVSALATGAIVLYSGLQIDNTGAITIGGIQAFLSYVMMMVWPVQEMARVFAEMQQAIASGERIFSLLDTEAEIVDHPQAMDPGTLRGDIVFEHVNFWYEDERKPVLQDFHLHIKAGETIALVGPTGGGKSTIVNLLCRFFEPSEGRVLIRGLDYTQMTQHAIQSRIGMVLQTPHLFSGSVRENIRYGRLNASDIEVEDAARVAGADEFIITLEKGYETQVGEGGVLLSTGQKQLISLARAVLAQPDIFIMDEATSSVDTLTEALIQKGMDALMQGRTSFVIAHRLSTIRNASRILVIEDGRIAEMGSHAELLRQGGHYYRLYTQQFREEKAVQYDVFGEQMNETAAVTIGPLPRQPEVALGD